MSLSYDDFPCPEAVEQRLSLIGEIEASWAMHPDETAIAVGNEMEILRVLSGKMPKGPSAEEQFFSDVLITLVGLAVADHTMTQVRVQGYHTTRSDCDLHPSREALARLERRDAVLDRLTQTMVSKTIYTREQSDKALDMFIDRSDYLGPAMAAHLTVAGLALTRQPPSPKASDFERPRVLSRRRR